MVSLHVKTLWYVMYMCSSDVLISLTEKVTERLPQAPCVRGDIGRQCVMCSQCSSDVHISLNDKVTEKLPQGHSSMWTCSSDVYRSLKMRRKSGQFVLVSAALLSVFRICTSRKDVGRST